MAEKQIVIRLTPAQAKLVFLNADGWIDAGACEDGLRPDEREALNCLCDQILAKLPKRKGKSVLAG